MEGVTHRDFSDSHSVPDNLLQSTKDQQKILTEFKIAWEEFLKQPCIDPEHLENSRWRY